MISSTLRKAAAIAAAVAMLALPPEAVGAGTYRVAVCHPGLGAWHADASFRRTSRHYSPEAGCGAGRPGLVVRHRARRTGHGRWGGWVLRAPQGSAIARVGVSASGRRAGGHGPELLTAPLHGPLHPFAGPNPGIDRARWSGGAARSFVARLSCRRASGCRRGRDAHVRVRRLTLRLADRISPTLSVGGSALDPGSRRGLQTVRPSASDVGGGLHRFLLEVNGEPLSAHTAPCRTAHGYGLRLQPCPNRWRTAFRLPTTAPPFRQGPNLLRICSADYARGAAANRRCAERRMRVDNLCPISATGPGPELSARLARVRGRRGGRTAVRGRLRSASGVPIAGARVCVATRVPVRGAAERIVSTPTTGSDGRFAARLPKGPNRRVRIAYWWDADHVAERHLRLRVRARPRLRLRPRHPIRNGHRAHFKVRLRGPAARRRWVRIKARVGKRWVEVRNGRTSARGVFRARYRFRSTTGRHRYAFRALVPKQRGYPYRRGHSKIRRVTVVG
jgi:hypothetical protein